MKGKGIVVVAILTVLTIGFAPMAAAQTSSELVQFETQSLGGRTLTLNVAPEFPAITNLTLAGGDIATLVDASATVSEVFAQGGSWSVKAQMCGPDAYGSPSGSDCVNHPNRMVRAAGTGLPAADILEGSLIAVTHAAPVVLLGGGTTTVGSEADLSGQITLLNNTGQNPLTAYNGTYTSSTDLSLTDFDRIGVWKGMWVVTATL